LHSVEFFLIVIPVLLLHLISSVFMAVFFCYCAY